MTGPYAHVQHGMQESPEDDVDTAGFPLAGLDAYHMPLAESGRGEESSGEGAGSPRASWAEIQALIAELCQCTHLGAFLRLRGRARQLTGWEGD